MLAKLFGKVEKHGREVIRQAKACPTRVQRSRSRRGCARVKNTAATPALMNAKTQDIEKYQYRLGLSDSCSTELFPSIIRLASERRNEAQVW